MKDLELFSLVNDRVQNEWDRKIHESPVSNPRLTLLLLEFLLICHIDSKLLTTTQTRSGWVRLYKLSISVSVQAHFFLILVNNLYLRQHNKGSQLNLSQLLHYSSNFGMQFHFPCVFVQFFLFMKIDILNCSG